MYRASNPNEFRIADSAQAAIVLTGLPALEVVGRSTIPSHLRCWHHVSPHRAGAGAFDGGCMIDLNIEASTFVLRRIISFQHGKSSRTQIISDSLILTCFVADCR
jgi:hypothetical protein